MDEELREQLLNAIYSWRAKFQILDDVLGIVNARVASLKADVMQAYAERDDLAKRLVELARNKA